MCMVMPHEMSKTILLPVKVILGLSWLLYITFWAQDMIFDSLLRV